MKYLVIVLALVLAGCSNRPAPAPQIEWREVLVPGPPVPCRVKMPAKPSYAVDNLPLGADIYQQMQALRAEREQRKGREHLLEVAVRSCQ